MFASETRVTTGSQIRALAKAGQYGQPRTPRNFYMTSGDTSWYWPGANRGSQARWDHLAAVLARYHRLVQWAEEVLPEWRTVRKLSYADNSVELEQVCKCGQHTRRVMAVPPSGDLCY